MRSHRRYLGLVGVLAFAAAMSPSIASSATTATVEAISAGVYPYWHPEEVAVTTGGGIVTFVNSSAGVPHGIVWKSTPATPACQEGAGQVPVGSGKWSYSWKGDCTFSQEGVYKYYCSYHGEAMSGTIYVNASGTIPPPPPSATTEAATALTETGATLKGSVDPNGQATEYFFKYGPTSSYGTETAPQSAGSGTTNAPESASVTGLSPGTTYHFELVATYASGASTVLGGDRTFTTVSPPGAPSAETGLATAIGETTATLKGTVNPNGQATEYVFEWGTSDAYGHATSSAALTGEDHSAHAVSLALSELAPSTVYHYRLVAKNASGPSPGADRQFATSSPTPPTPSSPTTTEAPPSSTIQFAAPALPKLEAPAVGPGLVAGSLKLTAPRHASSVRGSLQLGAAGAGGTIEVDLLAKGSSLSKSRGSRSKSVRVGRFSHHSIKAGRVAFTIALSAQAKRALTRRHTLSVTVKVTLTPPLGQTTTVTRTVLLRA
jgi:plastocyanin